MPRSKKMWVKCCSVGSTQRGYAALSSRESEGQATPAPINHITSISHSQHHTPGGEQAVVRQIPQDFHVTNTHPAPRYIWIARRRETVKASAMMNGVPSALPADHPLHCLRPPTFTLSEKGKARLASVVFQRNHRERPPHSSVSLCVGARRKREGRAYWLENPNRFHGQPPEHPLAPPTHLPLVLRLTS
jgi:hypothetical protein